MNAVAPSSDADAPPPGSCAAQVAAAIEAACRRIAPLWPLDHFVAVNPFLGFTAQTFAHTCAAMRRIAGARMLRPRSAFRDAWSRGRFTRADLAAGWERVRGVTATPADLEGCVRALQEERCAAPGAVVATVAEVLDRLAAGNRYVAHTQFMVEEISRWCAAYFDQGQAAWRLPARKLPLYAAWCASMRHDRNAAAMGIGGLAAALAALPTEPRAAIAAVVRELGIPPEALTDYLHRALFDIGGWASYVRYLVWESELHGRPDTRLEELLAVRVVYGYALFRERNDATFRNAWRAAMAAAATVPRQDGLIDEDLLTDLILQAACEIAWERQLLAGLRAKPARATPPGRPRLQVAMCIDVRSEVFRRALEACEEVETIGFAGFFGVPIEYRPIGSTRSAAQCPVLLKPAFTVRESVAGASAQEESRILSRRLLRRRAAQAWKAFKLSAVSSFTYVETMGLPHAAKLLSDGLGLTRPVPHPRFDGLDAAVLPCIGPRIDPAAGASGEGFDARQRVQMAEAILRAMSMTRRFARTVLLAGHGSTTVNNPHASSLDCGACGGHTGEVNARLAAAILNDPDVRSGLRLRGIEIPVQTRFVAGLHDTCTDELRLYEVSAFEAQDPDELEWVRAQLREAGSRCRRERARALGVRVDEDLDRQVLARARDWAQVRPEWGLAGNAAFIAAPRHRTRGLDLGGRVFLHEYAWQEDQDFRILESIMTAPMVVASWINLQYYASTVDHRAWGAGNKVLHNIVGHLGVLEGNGGDLKTGLPWQSVHDGRDFVHEPLRLAVLIEAPREAIAQAIRRHGPVRDLVENDWLRVFALDGAGNARLYRPGGGWGAAPA